MAIKLSLNRTLYSYDNQLEAHATDTTVIKVQIYTEYDLSDSVLVYKQGDVQDSVAIVDNAAEIPGLNIRSGQLSVAVLYANTLSNFVQIYVTKAAALSQTLVDDDPYFTVDRNKRLISVPSTQDMFAVNFDENSEIITFKFPRYADGVDLSTKDIYVNYERSDKTRNKALCTLTDISDSYVIFTWVVSAYATQAEGILNFNIEFHSVGYRWQTQPTSLLVYRSLLYTGETVPDQPELLEQYLAMFSELNSHPPIPGDDGYWQIWSLATHSYETSEFLLPTVDSTLTKAGQAADAKATGDAIRSLSEEKVTMPVDTGGIVQNGTSGQILQSNGDGTTRWVNKPSGVSSSGITDINIKKWFGKKIVVDGSSITSGGSGNTLPTWHSFIKDMFALDTVYDHSLSGSNWLYSSSAYPSSYSRLQDYEDDADAVIIMGDFSSSHGKRGTIDDEANVEGDTYYARLKGYADALVAKYPLCPIIWVIEPPRNVGNPSEMSDSRKRAEDITAAIKAVAEYYGFPVADCFHKTIFRQYNETNYAETTSDGTHPWNNIQRTMAQVIAETMKGTPLFYNESYVVTPDYSGDGDDSGGGTTDVTLTKITASANSGYTLFESDTLDTVKSCIRVVATYSDLSEKAVTDYTISGEITAGQQTFNITYKEVTTTVVLNVTAGDRTVTIALADCLEKSGRIISHNGAEASVNETVGYSQMLAVKPGSIVTLSYINSGWPAIISCYDASGTFSNLIKGVYGTRTYTLYESTYYIRVNGIITDQTITYVPA